MAERNAASERYAARTPEAVDQIPDSSRGSVARIPARRSRAVPVPSRALSGELPSRRLIQPRTVAASAPLSAAAWRGARRASARSVQWLESEKPLSRRVAPTSALDNRRAPSQVAAPVTGDQRRGVTPSGTSTVPDGSYNQHRPR